VGPRDYMEVGAKEKNRRPSRDSDPGRPALSQVTMVTELHRLLDRVVKFRTVQ